MDNSEFSKKYWSELKPFIGDMISNAQLHSNKGEYVKKCFNDLEIKLNSVPLFSNVSLIAFFSSFLSSTPS